MTRAHRIDVAGAYYHVWNRAIARRSYMEQRADFRYFKSRLAYAVRREEIGVVAFALMTTYFHLLLRSLGGLSKALRRIQNEYGRRFNRLRKRDGALVRARFGSKRITTLSYRRNALFYIDENPVQARLAQRPEEYKWGSAHLYAQEHRPLWLDTAWVTLWISATASEPRGSGPPSSASGVRRCWRRAWPTATRARIHSTT